MRSRRSGRLAALRDAVGGGVPPLDQLGLVLEHLPDVLAVDRARFDLVLPARLTPDRTARSEEAVACPVEISARLTAGADRWSRA